MITYTLLYLYLHYLKTIIYIKFRSIAYIKLSIKIRQDSQYMLYISYLYLVITPIKNEQ